MISKKELQTLYAEEGKSMQAIAIQLSCSLNTISYWMNKYNLRRRSISEAIYKKHNPGGDPFHFKKPRTQKEHGLFGMGLGLYWGEGTKANKYSIRLGNSDPNLILRFMQFLMTFFDVKKSDFRFGLQLFTDIDEKNTRHFWIKKLNITENQFYKTIITKSGSIGTYRKKAKYGVITLYYNNKKLRDLLMSLLQNKNL